MGIEKSGSEQGGKNRTTIERTSDRELVVTRTFAGPAALVFDAWTKPELVKRWWAPRSFGMELAVCEIDLRAGGKYRYEFAKNGATIFVAHGVYKEVERPTRLVWTNADAGDSVTTATFVETAGRTTVTLHELHASKEAFEKSEALGAAEGSIESFGQLDELLAGASR